LGEQWNVLEGCQAGCLQLSSREHKAMGGAPIEYLGSRSQNCDPAKIINHHCQNISTQSHMPFFEYAEVELMDSPMCINRLTLSIVQASILL
jgi:hypothetical protein